MNAKDILWKVSIVMLLSLTLVGASFRNVNAQVFETISISVVDSITGTPINGASVFLQIPSSTDANFSYYMANYATQLPIVVNGQTNMDGKITYSLDAGAIGALTMAHSEGMFTDFIAEVRIEHSDYETYQGYRRLSVGGQELSLKYDIQNQDTVSQTDVTTTFKPSSQDSMIIAAGGPLETYGSERVIGVSNMRGRCFVQFDLSSIPPGSKVSSATLRLYYGFRSDENPVGNTCYAYRITQSWTEEGVTWDKYDGTNEWSAPGGDYTTSGGYPLFVPSDQGTWVTWDVTLIARAWIDEGQTNYGILIRNGNEETMLGSRNYQVYFYSRDDPHSDLHPELRVSYTPGLPTIKIYVKDTSGNPINRAEVTSITQPSGQTTLAGTTSSEGYVTFEEVKSGSYTFLASSEIFESNSESVSASMGEIIEKTILLEEKPKGIPGFPNESIILVLMLVTFLLWSRART